MPRAPRTPSPSTRSDRACARKDSILRAALREFASRGYRDTDLDSVAAHAGCAKGTLYLHYQDKRELFLAAVDLVMRELVERTTTGAPDDPLGRIEHGVRAYLAYFDRHPEYVELLIQERAEFRDREVPTYFRYREAHRATWRALVRELVRSRRARAMPPDRPLDVIGDLLYGTIFTNYLSGRRRPLERQVRDVLDVVLCGLLEPAEAARRARARPGVRGTTAARRARAPGGRRRAGTR